MPVNGVPLLLRIHLGLVSGMVSHLPRSPLAALSPRSGYCTHLANIGSPRAHFEGRHVGVLGEISLPCKAAYLSSNHVVRGAHAGIHPKVVSERLGHATVSITLDTYSHAVPALQEEAAALIAGLLVATKQAGAPRRSMAPRMIGSVSRRYWLTAETGRQPLRRPGRPRRRCAPGGRAISHSAGCPWRRWRR